ncbi:GNAT family N-acetyltransferase [Erwinia sp. CPCC 100877]|nr:GNAT family N-acetyltransferase [Erwinia sp. CPCC 100877]
MDSTITIRPIAEKDFPMLMEIENMIWTTKNSPVVHHYNSVEEYKEKISNQRIFVAADSQQVHGFIGVHHPTPLLAHQKQWMLGIGVHPASQSLGIGKKLLDFLKETAKNEGIHKLSLRVMSANTKAVQFYRKNEFVQEAFFKDEFYIDGHYCDDYQFAFFIDTI